MTFRARVSAESFRFAGVMAGVVIGIGLLYLLSSSQQIKLEDVAILDGESYFASVNGVPIHCKGPVDADRCIRGARQSNSTTFYLWLGNSQLHAINQFKPGDINAPQMLFDQLRARNEYLVTFSEPNASLQEQLVLFAYLLPRLKPKALILPIVFDDFRETGLRGELLPALDDDAVKRSLANFEIGRRLLSNRKRTASQADDLAGIRKTLQERSERVLTAWLSEHSGIWAERADARGKVFLLLYRARNTLLGIKPTSTRKIIPAAFADNWAALDAILDVADRSNVTVYVYVAPIRNDLPIPYDGMQYQGLKSRLFGELAHRENVHTANLENAVPNQYWGTKQATALLGQPEYDFMHFQSEGHRFLARALDEFLADDSSTSR